MRRGIGRRFVVNVMAGPPSMCGKLGGAVVLVLKVGGPGPP
jgi:hypothetical protein